MVLARLGRLIPVESRCAVGRSETLRIIQSAGFDPLSGSVPLAPGPVPVEWDSLTRRGRTVPVADAIR